MADYGASDTSTTTLGVNQFPISEVYVPNASLTALEGGPVSTDGSGKKSSPASMYVKDGGNVGQGLIADTAVTGDNPGTISAKLRGLTKILADVWDSANHRLHVNVDNGNPNGQKTMVNSAPVVIASDQTAFPVSLAGASNNIGNVFVGANASTAFFNGAKDFHLVSAASINATIIKGSNGPVFGWHVMNTNAAWRYVKLYNKATAPAPGTDAALLVRTIGVPPGGSVTYFNNAGSQSYPNGIGLATTTGSADTDATAVGAGDLIIQIDWI